MKRQHQRQLEQAKGMRLAVNVNSHARPSDRWRQSIQHLPCSGGSQTNGQFFQ